MSRAYPNIVADSLPEIEEWYELQIKRVTAIPTAHVDADTGSVRCRLMPVLPTKAIGRAMWWPMPIEIVEQDKAAAYLQEQGVQYDRSRKSKVGYQRALAVGLS